MAEYIGREAAKRAVDEAVELSASEYDMICDYLDRIPAADVAPVVHGRWISWEQADNFIPSARRHECSACHDAAQVLVNGFELLSDYCPNCGARMDGDVDAKEG